MIAGEFEAGPQQTLVIYEPPDTGSEIDPLAIFAEISADAASRAGAGLRVRTMTALPLRHSGTYVGRTGSGYETKVAIAVLYEHV
jgi:hypothetical protein